MPETLPAPAAPFELVSGLAAFTEHAIRVAEAARMELVLWSPALDRRVYGDERFVAAVRKFALEHRRARLRALVLSPARVAMQSAHRLVELGRVLSSRIEFRQPDPDLPPLPAEEFLIADERVLLHRRSPEELEARYQQTPLEARNLLRRFNAAWDAAVPAREFSVLGL